MTRFWFSRGGRENKPHLGQELNSSGWLRKKLRRALASKSEISFGERQAACGMSAKFHFDLHSGQRTSSFPSSSSWLQYTSPKSQGLQKLTGKRYTVSNS